MLNLPYCDNGESLQLHLNKNGDWVELGRGEESEKIIRLFIQSTGKGGATVAVSNEQEAVELGVDPETCRVSHPNRGGTLYEWDSMLGKLGGDDCKFNVQFLYRPTMSAEVRHNQGQYDRGEGKSANR